MLGVPEIFQKGAGTYSVKILDDNSYPIGSIDSRKGSRR
jgi:hypothetical protein